MLGLGCLFIVAVALTPRLVLLFLWVFSDWISRAFDTLLVPLLGIILLPYTTLFYILFWDQVNGVTRSEWIWVALAVFVDIAKWASILRSRHQVTGYSSRYPLA